MSVAEQRKPANGPAIRPDNASDSNGPTRAAVGALAAALLIGNWPIFRDLWRAWAEEPEYSHGFLVPAFAAMLLWLRRDQLVLERSRFSWWGIALLALAGAFHLTSTYLCYYSLRPFALIPCLTGVALICGGWPLLRWCWPAILFLGFMMPLPPRISGALAYPLQRMSTVASTYLLIVFGIPAVSEGNVIHLDHEIKIGVVEACSGLRMLILFFAISTWVALVSTKRPAWERCLIVASAAPIAMLSNVLRLSISGVLYNTVGQEQGDRFFHTAGGLLMGPAAVILLILELRLLNAMFESDDDKTAPRERRVSTVG